MQLDKNCENICCSLHDAGGGRSLLFRQVKAESDSTLRAIVTIYKWKI